MKDDYESVDAATTGSRGKYHMTISRMTVDKFGVKLFDKVSAVIAELVANGYDADADEVTVEAPMGVNLATLSRGVVSDSGYSITVSDTGHGMVPDVVNDFFLKVGGERRKDPARGDQTRKYGRKVMGRKGLGKLAPFGICETLEVVSSGGDEVDGVDAKGIPARGFKTSHFIMRRSEILTDDDSNYMPEVGPLDETVRPEPGTVVTMRDFGKRLVPDIKSLSRQLGQRFGVPSANWRINLVNTDLLPNMPDREMVVGDFSVATMPNTKIDLVGPTTEAVDASRQGEFRAKDEAGNDVPGAAAGFLSGDGKFYPVCGWVAYAKDSYRDDLMAGIRIYCRGRIAAQTAVFNRGSGFAGEHSVRSYLVGELHADWIDDDEDLIQTDRRDILWSEELGREFELWGQGIVALVGERSRGPERKKVWEDFCRTGDVLNRIERSYPGERWKPIREKTIQLARLLGERLRPAEAREKAYVDSVVLYSITLAPYVTLDDALTKAAGEEKTAMAAMTGILRTARVAELSSYGMIAEKRVNVIERVTEMKDDRGTRERELQELIEEAPWLINPLWSPITKNQQLSTLRKEFEKHFAEQTGESIDLTPFDESAEKARPDFVLSADSSGIQIIEIKRPKQELKNDEWDRIQLYIDQMEKFFQKDGNEEFRKMFTTYTVTLVSDGIDLSGSQRKAFLAFREEGKLIHMTWPAFLLGARRMHEEFLNEAENQRKLEVAQ